ncbi:MAG: carboxypeptidase regulatory-like domain-containing protein, partial [Gemmatimonadota bacterium]|nr:carboxypeptidase regulatory-like domain-containing protein [Gemmatimonadota bacterium]
MVENEGLSNVTVKITGMSESETLTGATGQYAFTGLRAGNYTIEISGFDTDDIAFGATSSTAQVTVGESKVVSFDGTYLRASGVSGQVSVEGVGLAGVTVSLQGRGEDFTERTNAAGQFMFDKLRKGEYAVAISGYDDDEYGFDVTSKTVTVARGETGNVPFEGIALRTAGIKGTVTVTDHGPLDGVTVSLSGKGEDMAVVTNAARQWSFDRLHAGDYSVAISGYKNDKDEFGFDVTSKNVTVALKETATVEFVGILLRTAAIEGEVTVKGDALAGVTVTVSGGPKDEEFEETTNGAGMYEVGDLHAGDYSVTISGYDTDEYGFEVTTKSVSVGLRETAEVAFDGILLRTAGVSGRVTIDGDAMSGLTVKLAGEEDRSGMTDGNGQYAFSGLAAGDYTLTLSGYDTDEYEFDPSMMDIELELDEAAIHNFMGRSLRTVVIMGTVSAEGDGIMNVGVTLIKVLGATTGEVLGATMTDEDGGYMFDELLAGVYRVDLGETDDEYDFATKTRQGAVATDETAMWDFDADIIRTASVGGEVTLDGDPMGEVMVMLTGDHDTDKEMETGSDGMYMFDGLRKGSYTVSIENPDEDTYDFPTTSRSVSLSVGQEQDDISFAGSMLRRASISGQVHVEGMGLEGVMVTLDGDMEDEMMTDANGEYNFPGLAGGDYEVEIENPDEDAYTFEVMEMEVEDLGDEEARIVDFVGEHTMTASVSGMLFVDEVKVDSMYTEGEPMLAQSGFPLLLQGPGVNDSRIMTTDSTGMYSFDSLKAGTYNVVIDLNDKLKAALAFAGYAFSGNTLNIGIQVPAATDVDLDLPFRITKQTILAGALLSYASVKASPGPPMNGVRMELYPTAEDAQDGTNILGTATTSTVNKVPGVAKFDFDREDDKGPGGGAIDHLVYAKVVSTPTDIVAHDDKVIEIEYEAVDRVSHAPTVAKLINTRVNFQWWVKSNATAKDGNQFLGGWAATNGSVTDANGRARYTGTVTGSQLAALIAGRPATYTISLNSNQADSVDMREKWRASGSLAYAHTGLEHPSVNGFEAPGHDRGAIYVTWTTQTLVLGLYRETDDVEGFTNYQSKVPGGDQRPASSVAREMEFTLLTRDDRNRLVP